jgi:hypothetical protein
MDISQYTRMATERYSGGIMKLYHHLSQKIVNRDILFNTSNTDGRVNSIMDEDTIIDMLITEFNDDIERQPPRSWCDLIYRERINDEEEIKYYINIKCSRGKTDNAMNKKAIIYSLTDIDVDDIKPNMNYNDMIRIIKNNIKETRNTQKEYYYLYIDKKDNSIILKSILDIQCLTSNPCNILQINWNKEKQLSHIFNDDDIAQSYNNIMKVIAKSLRTFTDSCSVFLEDF